MSITLTADTAERIRELLSNTHDAALSDSDDDLASEIDTLCGALLGGEDASAEHPGLSSTSLAASCSRSSPTAPSASCCWMATRMKSNTP